MPIMCAVALRRGDGAPTVAMLAGCGRRTEGKIMMRSTTSMGWLGLVVCVLLLEFAGAGAYVASSAKANPSDACYGYAICQ